MNKIDNLLDFYNMLVPQVKPLGEHYGLCTVYVEVNVQTFKSNKELKRSLNRWLSYIFTMLNGLTKVIKNYSLDEQTALLEQYDRIVRAARSSIMVPWYPSTLIGWTEHVKSRHLNRHSRQAVHLLRRIRKELRNKCIP